MNKQLQQECLKKAIYAATKGTNIVPKNGTLTTTIQNLTVKYYHDAIKVPQSATVETR